MKKTTLLITFLTLCIFGCKKEAQTNYTILSGNVQNPVNDSVNLEDKHNRPLKTVYLSDDNSFNDTLKIDKGYYYLIHGSWNDRKLIFLTPSSDLNIVISNQDETSSYSFLGKGEIENNYLKQKIEFDKQFEKLENRKYFFSLDEETFLTQTDSIYSKRKNFLKSHTNIDSDFNNYETFKIEYDRAQKLLVYKNWRGDFIKDSTFTVSTKFPNPFENIDISDERLLTHPNYSGALFTFINNKYGSFHWNTETLTYLEYIDKEIENKKIKEELATGFINLRILRHNGITLEAYTKYLSMATNKESIKKVKTYFDEINKIGKGTISPLFEFYDLNDNLIKLKDLQGKLVYIDIWGTWCIPCVREIPALKKFEEEFRNEAIHFVSISVNDEKEKLKQFIKENDLKGIQLFVKEGGDETFFEEYQVQGVPRFILIDKEGKIINAFADKPSNPNIRALILESL
ncbi:MAG: TlpA disulfide reductase family protein [Urechidicola sp.]|nr:TlpA disulfide reductase family protein [Urechidicola sp.]